MKDVHFLNKLIETCFAMMAACSLNGKHTQLENGFPD